MDTYKDATLLQTAPLFLAAQKSAQHTPLPLSSPAFSTPVHPIRVSKATEASKPSILPILLPPATLRPLAFRTFTKKHNLTLTSSALQIIATFIGKYCGSGWREEGLAEKILDEAAKVWKKNGGGVIVPGEGDELKSILRSIEGRMSGEKPSQQSRLSRQVSFVFGPRELDGEVKTSGARPVELGEEDSQNSLGLSALDVEGEEESNGTKDPRRWLKVVGAFDQPRLTYNVNQRHFGIMGTAASLLPNPSHKTYLFRHRYNLIHQRLLRNESFQTSSVTSARTNSLRRSSTMATPQQAYKLTPIANLLGRSGSSHLLLGLLTISPTGLLTVNDLTGSISLDIQHARPVPEDGAWFAPGMIVLVDGEYEEEPSAAGPGLDGNRGVGGTVGGKFIAFSIGGPPCERREVTLGVGGAGKEGNLSAGGGFGRVDFLGVGSERASGLGMRRLESTVLKRRKVENLIDGRGRLVILGEVNLDSAKTLQALKRVLGLYAAEPAEQTPMTVVLMGNFVRYAVMTGGGSGGSIEYKEYFDSLASALSDYPTMLHSTTFIFVPGDNDPWASAFSAGAATVLPQNAIPELFTSRVKKAFANANAEVEKTTGKKTDGEAIWSTNPVRLSLFGPAQEVVFFRDDMSGRLRRNAVRFRPLEVEIATDGTAVENQGSHDEATAVEHQQENDNMDVDSAVKIAISHVPASKAREPANYAGPSDLQTARKLVKTILDQGYLSPFSTSARPVLWDHASALQLYPLPTALVLADPEAPPFAVTYEGCHVMNPGPLTPQDRRGVARWMEYDARTRRGKTREARF